MWIFSHLHHYHKYYTILIEKTVGWFTTEGTLCTLATTLSAALAKMQGQYSNDYPSMMAAAVLAILPMVIIYVIFQKQFVEGIATSGGKL